jgi:hypothetical protein
MIVHEFNHVLFFKLFKIEIDEISIGIIAFTKKKVYLSGKKIWSGSCSFVYDSNISKLKYYLSLYAGGVLNIIYGIVTIEYMDGTTETQTTGLSVKPNETPTQTSNTSSGGCYVATAVYGSYDCPQVWTLRRYRDNQLAKTWYGRLFIHTYYAISPTFLACRCILQLVEHCIDFYYHF